MSQSARAYYDGFRQKPVGQGLINAVRFSEGTEGPQGYRTMFGGGLFDSYAAHPDRVVSANGYSSAAAGAGQFMPKTWAGIQQALGETDFSPAAQERGILYLGDQRLKPIGGLAALEKEGFSQRVSELLAPEWASFPTRSGKSYYGQPVKPLAEIQAAFARRNPGAVALGPAAQSRATDSPGGSPEDQFLAALSDPTRLTRTGALVTQADDIGTSEVPGLGDLTNPLDGIWKAIAAGTLGGGLASRLGLPRAIASNPAAELTLQGELKRRQAAQVLADAYTIMNPSINLSDLMQSSSRRPSKPRNDFMASLVSDDSIDTGVQPGAIRQGGNPQVIEYLTGDPEHSGFRQDHGGGNYHEHLAFSTREARDAAMAKLQAAGIQIGSVNDGRHSPNSYHYQDLAFDVPAAQVPVGQEQALSRRVRAILGLG